MHVHQPHVAEVVSVSANGRTASSSAHIVDMAQYLTGDVLTGVSALTETFVRERPLPAKIEGSAASSGLAASGGAEKGTVDVDDAALFSLLVERIGRL